MLKISSHHTEETILWGQKIGKKLKRGQIVCLLGEMGCGKTTFVKGLAKGLNIDWQKVHSPTFTLLNIYEPPKSSKKKINLFHFDLYRIEDRQDTFFLEYGEYLYGDGISVIEWADRLGPLEPQDHLSVIFRHQSRNTRSISMDLKGAIKFPDLHSL